MRRFWGVRLPRPESEQGARELVEEATRQRVAPLLYAAVSSDTAGWPAAAIEGLRERYHAARWARRSRTPRLRSSAFRSGPVLAIPEACRKWLVTRVTTPLRFSRSWTLRGCVRTYPNPTVVVGDGGATPRAVAWCTRTVGEAAGHEVSVCTASEENGWSDPSLISTEPAA